MKFDARKPNWIALWTAMAGILAFSLAACGPKDPAGNSATDMSRSSADAKPQLDSAPHQPLQNQASDSGSAGEKSTGTMAGTDDQDLSGKVQSALSAEPKLKAQPIQVQAAQGVVTLSGKVVSNSDRDQATTVASSVAGVKAVKNNLVVASNT